MPPGHIQAMATVPFDTLALARKLEAAGFAPKQAQDTAAALAETLGEEMPTRRDLSEATHSLRTEMRELEGRLRSEIKESEHRMTMRLGAMMAASIALVAALVRLL